MGCRRVLVMGLLGCIGSSLVDAGYEVIDMSAVVALPDFDERAYIVEEKESHEYASLLKHRTMPIRPVERKPRCYLKV